jgi:hypothetical protein
MKYLILQRWSEDSGMMAVEALQNDVQEYLDKGWKPQGSVCVVFSPTDKSRFSGNDGFEAFQALTHDGEPE